MTQRLSTKIGTQGGLESNVETGQSQGYQVADNVVYRPIGGLMKLRGSKKLVESKTGESKRALLPTTTSVLSVQEVDSTGEGKVLGYSKAGTRVDLYSLAGSRNLTLNPDAAFLPYDKLRLAFDDAVFELASDFIEDAFARKLAALDGFWTPESSFLTVAVEQDSVDTDLLRVSTFANFPLLIDEITITASASLSTPPDTTVRYDIVDWNATYFTIYPTGGSAPSWTSTGDTGTISFSLKTLEVIEVDDTAVSTESLTGQPITAHYEVEGEVPTNFSADEITLVSQDRGGDEIVFNSNLGQMWLSDESASAPKVSYYGVPRAIDAVPFTFERFPTGAFVGQKGSLGGLEIGKTYAYCSVFKKTINDQVFLGTPSPFFYITAESTAFTSATSLTLNANGELEILLSDLSLDTNRILEIGIQFRNAVTTPAIPDNTVFKAESDLITKLKISPDEQIRVLGATLSSVTSADLATCPAGVVSCAIPEELWSDYNREAGVYEYAVQIYRSVGVDLSVGNPDITQMFLAVEQTFPSAPMPLPHIVAIDGNPGPLDFELESRLPLYTNVTEEGVLASNDAAPRYQNSVSKNGVFYLGDLKRKKTIQPENNFSLGFSTGGNIYLFEGDNTATTVSRGTRVIYTNTLPYNFSYLEFSQNSVDPAKADIDVSTPNGNVFARAVYAQDSTAYFWASRLDTGETFLAKIGSLVSGTTYELVSLNGDLNPPASGTVKFIAGPLYGSGSVGQFVSLRCCTRDTFLLEQYSLCYRTMNLSPYETQTYLSDDLPGRLFAQRGRFNLYFQGQPQPTATENLSATVTLERRLLESYDQPFPAFNNLIFSAENTFELEPARYQVAYSKPFEPAAFPALNFLNVGSTDNIVYGLFLVRDSILIASKEGFYRLTGDQAADFALTPIERDTVPLSPLLMAEQQDQVYALTQKGLVAATESTVSVVDAAVQDITEKFLSLYTEDIDSLSEKVLYTGRKPFLNALIFYMPSLASRDTSKSAFGLMLDSTYKRFSTVDLYTSDGEKYGVHSQSYNDLAEIGDAFSTPSLAPSALYQERDATDRSDFAQDEWVITLQNSWTATGSVTASSDVLTVTTGLDHRLQAGDYVKLVSGSGDLLTTGGLASGDFDGVHIVTVSSDKIFQVTLPSTASAAASGDVVFRFGRQGLAGTLSLTAASATATLTFAADVDAGWSPGGKIRIQKPWSASLTAALSSTSDLEGAREILTATAGSLTFALSAPASGSFSGSVTWSDGELREPFGKSFAVPSSSFSQDDLAIVTPFSGQVFFPFSFEKRTASLTQGFLERTLPAAWAADRPARLFTSFPATVVTARVTGGDPCSLKSFEQIVVTWQNFLACTRAKVAFQGDRYAAAGGVTWVAQTLLEGPFDPAFSDAFWSALFSQWASITAPASGWVEGTPFPPMRLTVPTEVAQSTYLALILRHERPLEHFALGSIAVNGTFIDPTSVGV